MVKVSCSLAKWFRKDFEFGGFNPSDPRQIRMETELMDQRQINKHLDKEALQSEFVISHPARNRYLERRHQSNLSVRDPNLPWNQFRESGSNDISNLEIPCINPVKRTESEAVQGSIDSHEHLVTLGPSKAHSS